MSSLTEDEATVLMIAAKGESIIAIARWEKLIDDLVGRGLMQRLNKHNNVITLAGQQALEQYEKGTDEDLRQVLGFAQQIANVRTQASLSGEQAANHLLIAARASSAATGDSLESAIRKWGAVAIERAIEMSK